MTYTDNPQRPYLRYWFGPTMMVDYLQNYNMDNNISNYFYMQPGDSYEALVYTAKQAYAAAINTMSNEHPNDWVSLITYSWPRTSANASVGRFNCVRCPLGTNYSYASACPFVSVRDDQCRWLVQQYRDHSLYRRSGHRRDPLGQLHRCPSG